MDCCALVSAEEIDGVRPEDAVDVIPLEELGVAEVVVPDTMGTGLEVLMDTIEVASQVSALTLKRKLDYRPLVTDTSVEGTAAVNRSLPS